MFLIVWKHFFHLLNLLLVISWTLLGQLSHSENLNQVISYKSCKFGTSLVAQWLRIRLPMQGTQVRALVPEDPTCTGATKLMRPNY